MSSDPVLPTTLHPLSLANWPANIPTPPAAADTKTFEPDFGCPSTSIPTHAANPGIPIVYEEKSGYFCFGINVNSGPGF